MSIAEHHCENHEATNKALADIRGLAHAVDLILPDELGATPAAEAIYVVLSALMARLKDLDRLRSAEWAGLGGVSPDLSAEEAAQARGEKAAA